MLGRQKVGYGMVADGFAKFQTLNFGIQGLKFVRDSLPNQQNKGFCWKFQALKSKFQGLKFCDSIHRHSIPHPLPAEIPIFEALGQNRANRVFSPIHIEIRVIRVQSSLLSHFLEGRFAQGVFFVSKRESIRANRPTKLPIEATQI